MKITVLEAGPINIGLPIEKRICSNTGRALSKNYVQLRCLSKEDDYVVTTDLSSARAAISTAAPIGTEWREEELVRLQRMAQEAGISNQTAVTDKGVERRKELLKSEWRQLRDIWDEERIRYVAINGKAERAAGAGMLFNKYTKLMRNSAEDWRRRRGTSNAPASVYSSYNRWLHAVRSLTIEYNRWIEANPRDADMAPKLAF